MAAEFKRLIAQPIWWILMAGCLFVNGWLLGNYAGQRDLVLESGRAAAELGPLSEENQAEYIRRLEPFDPEERPRITPWPGLKGLAVFWKKTGKAAGQGHFLCRKYTAFSG